MRSKRVVSCGTREKEIEVVVVRHVVENFLSCQQQLPE